MSDASYNDLNHSDLNYYSGVDIDNGYGSGSVTIKSSKADIYYMFESNTLYGLNIISQGSDIDQQRSSFEQWHVWLVCG